jgi:hypothetical protein
VRVPNIFMPYIGDNACPGCPFRDGQCSDCRPAAEVWSKSPAHERDAAIERERLWVERGEVWGWGRRLDYNCDAHVLDEIYYATRQIGKHRDDYVIEYVCATCYEQRHGGAVDDQGGQGRTGEARRSRLHVTHRLP